MILNRGWRWIPATMTVGGIIAVIPDLPRFFREVIPGAPLAGLLGDHAIQRLLEDWGNLFFFHRALDSQPNEFALHGLILIIVLYNAAIIGLMWLGQRQRRPARREALHGPYTHAFGDHGDDDPVIQRIGPDGEEQRGVRNE